MKYELPIEYKGIIQVITNQTKQLFSVAEFSGQIKEVLRDEYLSGLNAVDKEIKPTVNVQIPNNAVRQLEGLYNYVEQNIQDHIDQIGSALRQEIQRGLQNNESKEQIISRVKKVFQDDKQVINRLKMVVRTETARASNTGRLEAANQIEASGTKMIKWLDVAPYIKGVSSPFCNTPAGSNAKNSANGKYGEPSKGIPLSEEFIVKADNKTVKAQAPPFHVNCRTTLRVQEKRNSKKDERKEYSDKEINQFLNKQ